MKISFKLRLTQTLQCMLSQRTLGKDGGIFYLSALQIFNLFNILSLFCLETKFRPPRIKAQHTIWGSGVAHASQGTHLWAGVGTAYFQRSGDGGWMEKGQRPHHCAQACWSVTKDQGPPEGWAGPPWDQQPAACWDLSNVTMPHAPN